ncbi:MAG: hypothetical protein QOH79_1822 [Acidimicrobiaceae bacterium]
MKTVRKSARLAVAATTIAIASCGLAGVASAQGPPPVGSVGNGDTKAPKGQTVDDNNHGYECDANNGVGQGNPAHSHNCQVITPTL